MMTAVGTPSGAAGGGGGPHPPSMTLTPLLQSTAVSQGGHGALPWLGLPPVGERDVGIALQVGVPARILPR